MYYICCDQTALIRSTCSIQTAQVCAQYARTSHTSHTHKEDPSDNISHSSSSSDEKEQINRERQKKRQESGKTRSPRDTFPDTHIAMRKGKQKGTATTTQRANHVIRSFVHLPLWRLFETRMHTKPRHTHCSLYKNHTGCRETARENRCHKAKKCSGKTERRDWKEKQTAREREQQQNDPHRIMLR